MNRKIAILFGFCIINSFSLSSLAQGNEDTDIFSDELDEEEEAARKAREEQKRREEEARAKRELNLKLRRAEEAKRQELKSLIEASPDTTEYTIDPSSVELLVELDPNSYGFRTRTHRMVLSTEFDALFRGRGFLRYDYRFFEYLSLGLMFGVDWTNLSLFEKFRQQMQKPSPKQFSVLGGLAARIRLTEWYLHSSVFIEPSFLFGKLWQEMFLQNSNHWRIRPGIFGGIESIFDSGFALTFRVGMEFPFDFGMDNPVKETVEPTILLGFGLAL